MAGKMSLPTVRRTPQITQGLRLFRLIFDAVVNNSPAPDNQQAAVYCACSVWAIRQVIWSKELPACMIGRRLLIDRGDLDRFIDARLRERAS
jgi:excisionase family DNA binding protein